FFSALHIVALDVNGIAFDAGDHAAESLAAVSNNRHFDLHKMTGMTLEIGAAHQRTIDAGRGYFEAIGALDGIGDVEHRRERARHGLAILDQHGSVRPLRHDLHRAAGLAGNADADQPVAHAL